MRLFVREAAAPTLALFASLSTLLCCALPALLISIGAGAVMAGLATNVPGLIWLSEHKMELFAVTGSLLAVSAVVKWMTRNAPCPADVNQAQACQRLRSVGTVVLVGAAFVYLIGGFFAFFAADFVL